MRPRFGRHFIPHFRVAARLVFCIVSPALLTRRGVDIRLNLDFGFLYNNKGVVMDNQTIIADRCQLQLSRKGKLRSKGLSILALSIGLALPGAAYADAPADSTAAQATVVTNSGDIVVTARRREEKLIDVPISLQAISAADLAANQITSLDTLQTVGGFTFNSQGASFFGGGREFPSLIFRGMASNYGGGRGDSGALFIDGIYISGGAASVTLADASRVEVLKGPQSVYFGKNTFGGAVNLVTSNPSETLKGSITAGYSTKGSFDDVAMIEGAIVPGVLTARLTGEWLHQGKQYTAADGGDLGKQDTKGVTLVLYATPSPDVWMRGRVHYSHDNDSAVADGFISGQTYGTTCAGLTNKYFCNGIPSLGSLNPQAVLSGTTIPAVLLSALAANNFGTAASPVPGLLLNQVPSENQAGLVRNNLQASLQGGVKVVEDAELQFSAGYNQQKSLDITSSDHTPNNVFTSAFPFITTDLDLDARIVSNVKKPFRVVVGFNYFKTKYQETYDGNFFANFANSGPTNENTSTYAVYGSAEYDITSFLTATGEMRYQSDKISDASLYGQPATLTTPVAITYKHSLPRAILRYHPSEDFSVYGSYSIGVQPPQLQTSYIEGNAFTQAAITALGGGGSFTKDPTLQAWEVGTKKSFDSGHVFISLAYFNQIWKNALVANYIFNDPANNCSTVPVVGVSTQCPYPGSGISVYSVSRNHIQGLEFEGTAHVTPQLTAHATVNWTDAKRSAYDDQSWAAAFTSGKVPSQNGNRIDLVPQIQFSADLTYKDHLAGDFDWFVHGMVNYTGSQYAEATDIAKLKGYYRANLSLGISKGRYALEGYVTNLFNDKNWNYAVRFPDPAFFFGEAHQGVIAAAPNPRNFGFRLSAKF
jgi:iron complex outermembrane receptor protein